MRGLIGSVLAPEVHQALTSVVESGAAPVFVADERSRELDL
jgi:hypothetical protein